MTVYKAGGCEEYIELIADVMITLDQIDSDEYTLKIWTNGNDLPYKFHSDDELVFMQEGIRATKHITSERINIVYIWYDAIDDIVVMNYDN